MSLTLRPETDAASAREIVWQNPHTNKSIELWNLVFTQFEGDALFKSPLETIAADSGASIDRIVTAIECSRSDYENSNWKGIVESITERSKVQDQAIMCRLADLGKASTLLVSQGLRPGNKAAEYVLRKLIREAYILCRQTSIQFDEFAAISESHWSPSAAVQTVLIEEVSKFEKGLERGKREYQNSYPARQFPCRIGYKISSIYVRLSKSFNRTRGIETKGGEMKNLVSELARILRELQGLQVLVHVGLKRDSSKDKVDLLAGCDQGRIETYSPSLIPS
ncbi:hypothetical protein IPM19_02870 [bacterium]|nr:MAG: hypothetical protein IPM19_02870 [bacterium]